MESGGPLTALVIDQSGSSAAARLPTSGRLAAGRRVAYPQVGARRSGVTDGHTCRAGLSHPQVLLQGALMSQRCVMMTIRRFQG